MTLEAQLSTLERAELIRLAQSQPDMEYFFRHAMVQDAAYQSLLKATRRELHQAIGTLLEREFADRLDECAPILARHFSAAEDLPRAIEYYLRAGAVAARQYANAEALDHFASALHLVRQARATHSGTVDTLALGMRAHLAQGRLLEIIGRYADALAGYHELEGWALAAADPSVEQAALTAQATLYSTPNPVHDPVKGRALMHRILPLARAAGDRAAEARILWNLMLSMIYGGGNVQEAKEYGEAALRIAVEAGLTELRALILHDIFFVYLTLDGPERADAVLVEAEALWRNLNNPPFLAETLVFRSTLAIMTGRYDDGIALAAKARQVGVDAKHAYSEVYADLLRGRVLEDRGLPGKAIALMENSVRAADAAENTGIRMFTRIDLGLAYGRLGALERAESVVAEAGRVMRANVPFVALHADATLARLRVLAGDAAGAREILDAVFQQAPTLDALRMRFMVSPPAFVDIMLAEAETRLVESDASGALAWLDESLRVVRSMQFRMVLCDALLLRVRALRMLGRGDEIGVALDEAEAAANALGAQRVLWQIHAERARGEGADASELRRRAIAIVEEIAADLADDELRRSYVASALKVIGA